MSVPYYLIFDSSNPTPVARYSVGHHADADADRRARETGRPHYVRRQEGRDVTRPVGDGTLVYATQEVGT